ncbi:hypothetical protein Pyrfu_0858 [Pyrolobus fumarii 1A]|uniref:Uncharacterized protein n=1 Tax=Pyrolobus fumarii (strain DSM 11204 / 1A) TaxID=694429 RepID=G0EDV8_PYRF1|nr:hypothetical protein [Pyrolobus fumarii]AEM38727.1 hypothetical protein Pyrfu_0858 [Pyrolobus fumarii 1A]
MVGEEKPVTFIEGLVYLGHVKKVELLECQPGFARVAAHTRDGHVYVTKCLHVDAARKLHSVWNIYITQGWKVEEVGS